MIGKIPMKLDYIFGILECVLKLLRLTAYSKSVKYTGAGKYETLTTLRCSGTKRLLTSWL